MVKKDLSQILMTLAFLVLGLLWLFVSFSLPNDSVALVFGSPRTFPQIISCLIIFVSLIQLRQQLLALRKTHRESATSSTSDVRHLNWRIPVLIAATASYILLIQVAGFLPATIVLLGTALWIYGYRNKLVGIFLVILFPAALLLIFRYLLKVPLP